MIKINQTYIVKAGDTLYGISNQFGVSVTELANLNNVNASTLQIGQKLIIPQTSGTNPNNMFMYTVKKGDSLYSIAQKYNTTVQAISNLNNLKTAQIQRTDWWLPEVGMRTEWNMLKWSKGRDFSDKHVLEGIP